MRRVCQKEASTIVQFFLHPQIFRMKRPMSSLPRGECVTSGWNWIPYIGFVLWARAAYGADRVCPMTWKSGGGLDSWSPWDIQTLSISISAIVFQNSSLTKAPAFRLLGPGTTHRQTNYQMPLTVFVQSHIRDVYRVKLHPLSSKRFPGPSQMIRICKFEHHNMHGLEGRSISQG